MINYANDCICCNICSFALICYLFLCRCRWLLVDMIRPCIVFGNVLMTIVCCVWKDHDERIVDWLRSIKIWTSKQDNTQNTTRIIIIKYGWLSGINPDWWSATATAIYSIHCCCAHCTYCCINMMRLLTPNTIIYHHPINNIPSAFCISKSINYQLPSNTKQTNEKKNQAHKIKK